MARRGRPVAVVAGSEEARRKLIEAQPAFAREVIERLQADAAAARPQRRRQIRYFEEHDDEKQAL